MRKSAAERREEIVTATLALAAEVGPDRLSTTRIAREVGISQPALFRHFPSTRELWAAVFDALHGRLRQAWTAAETTSGDARDRLHALLRAQLTVFHATPALPALLFSHQLHAGDAEWRQGFLALMQGFLRRLTETVALGVSQGEFEPGLDPGQAARLVLALIQGLALRWSLGGQGFDLLAEGEALLALQLRAFDPRATTELS